MRVLSARIDPPVRRDDGSTASTGDLMALSRQHAAQRIDGGRLADPRRTGNANPHRLAGRSEQRLGQRGGRPAMIRALTLD